MIKTIILDMNGVIIDDEPLHELAFKEVCRSHGKVLTTELYRELCMGRSDQDGSLALVRHFSLGIDWQTLFTEKQKQYYRFAEQDLIPAPGLIDALKRLRGAYALGVGSSVRREDLTYVLERFAIAQYFTAWVGRDEVAHGKPAPDIYLEVSDRLTTPPRECLVIEDSLVGIQSVKNAGMLCLGITTTHTPDELTSADAYIDTFDQLTGAFIQSLQSKL